MFFLTTNYNASNYDNIYLKNSQNKYIINPNTDNENIEFNRKLFLTIAKLEFVNKFSILNNDLEDMIFIYSEYDRINITNMRTSIFVNPFVCNGPSKKTNIKRIADAFR
mgnify:CR=1 FL=1|jgi:hypothetical protein